MNWKQYKVFWCGLCNCISIKCFDCGYSSCVGSSCSKCHEDFTWFIHNGDELFKDHKAALVEENRNNPRTEEKLLDKIFGK